MRPSVNQNEVPARLQICYWGLDLDFLASRTKKYVFNLVCGIFVIAAEQTNSLGSSFLGMS